MLTTHTHTNRQSHVWRQARCLKTTCFAKVAHCTAYSSKICDLVKLPDVSWCNGRMVRTSQTSEIAYPGLCTRRQVQLLLSKQGRSSKKVSTMIHIALYVFTISIFAFCVSFLFLKDYLTNCYWSDISVVPIQHPKNISILFFIPIFCTCSN